LYYGHFDFYIMCLIIFAYKVHPIYKMLFAANRDEFYDRPTAPAHWWDESPDVLGGRDLEAGGSWLGISKQGKLAALTNYREPQNIDPNTPSRGHIITNFLLKAHDAQSYSDTLRAYGSQYNGFNLLYGHIDDIHYFSNRSEYPVALSPGIYGLSNHLLDTPWPKVVKGKEKMASYASMTHPQPDTAITWLYDKELASDQQLPQTGVGLSLERTLSAMFIQSPTYGTRSSTVIFVDYQDRVFFQERSYVPAHTQQFEFTIQY